MSDCVGRFTLIRWLLGELSADHSARITAHLETCKRCQRTVTAAKANMAEFDIVSPERYETLRERFTNVRSAVERKRFSRRAAVLAVASTAAAAAVVIALLQPLNGVPELSGARSKQKNPNEIQYKGEFGVNIIVKRGARQFTPKNGDLLKQGDILRFVVTVSEPGYLTIFSIDSTNKVTPFYPDSPPAIAKEPYFISRAGRQELPGAIELDAVVGEESIIVAFSPKPFDRRQLHSRVSGISSKESRNGSIFDPVLGSVNIKTFRFARGAPKP